MTAANDPAIAPRRRTLRSMMRCEGVGLHSGRTIAMTLRPALEGGIVFRRTDLGVDIPARWDNVVDTRLCTVIGQDGATVGTIEHLMAALAAAGVDDCLIEIDGPEVPAMDGSAAPFLFLIDCAGLCDTLAPRRVIEVTAPIQIGDDTRSAQLLPHDGPGLVIDFAIDFTCGAIGAQRFRGAADRAAFKRDMARARTFGRLEDVEAMRAAGLGLGGGFENAIVVDGDKVLNPGGLRFEDEFVRHKALDAVGDLALAGAPISALYVGDKAGHALNNQVLRALFAAPQAWRWSDAAALGAGAPPVLQAVASPA